MCSDPNSPICQRWAALGGMSALGATVSGPTHTADGRATFQEFTNGALFLTSTGVYRVAKSIFEKWKSLSGRKAADGTNLRDFVGYPVADDFTFNVEFVLSGTPNVPFARGALFERGFVVAFNILESKAVLVYDKMYEAYLAFGLPGGGSSAPPASELAAGLADGRLALPLADEQALPGGGRIQKFQRADVYLRPAKDASAFVVLGAIRERWQKLGGVAGQLGFPTSHEIPVVGTDGSVIGQMQKFFGGFVYWSQPTGAWEVLPPILRAYTSAARGGPAGPLGFPVSAPAASPTGLSVYNNFQRGVIAHRLDGSLMGEGALMGAPRVVLAPEFFVMRFAGTGGDEAGSSGLEISVNATVGTSEGVLFNGRLPAGGFFKAEQDVNLVFPVPNPVRGDTVVMFDFQGKEDDSFGGDTLGRVTGTYNVDNYWGLPAGLPTFHDDAFHVTCGMREPSQPLVSGVPWRQQAFWSFGNAAGVFPDRALTTKHYADTFSDIDDGTLINLNPKTWVNEAWEVIYYHAVYKSLAETGHCFGMCSLAARALAGSVFWTEPIFSNFNLTTPGLVDEIKVSHGRQAGAEVIDWVVGQAIALQTHNPTEVFEDSFDASQRGDFPVLCVTDGFFGGRNHVVMPYAWDANSKPWRIWVANPNFPPTPQNPSDTEVGDDDPRCVVSIDPDDNSFTLSRNDGAYEGGSMFGGRLYYVPLSEFISTPRTPGYEVLALLYSGCWFVLGDGGETEQISNDKGQTFYDPNLKGPPTRWEQIRRAGGIPNLVRVPFFDARSGLELYAGRGDVGDIVHRVRAKPGASPKSQYQWAFHSPELSVALRATAPGKTADAIRISNRRAFDPAVHVELAAGGAAREVELAISTGRAAQKARRFRVQGVEATQSRRLTLRLVERGETLLIENDEVAPLTCQVTAGKGAAQAVSVPRAQSVRVRPDWAKPSAPFKAEPYAHSYRTFLEARGLPAEGGVRERFPSADSLRNLLRL